MKTSLIFAVFVILSLSSCKTADSSLKHVDRIDVDEKGNRVTLRFLPTNTFSGVAVIVCKPDCATDNSQSDWIQLTGSLNLVMNNHILSANSTYFTSQYGTSEPMKSIKILSEYRARIAQLEDEKIKMGVYFGKQGDQELVTKKKAVEVLSSALGDAKELSYDDVIREMKNLFAEILARGVTATYTPEYSVATKNHSNAGEIKAKLLSAAVSYFQDTNTEFARAVPKHTRAKIAVADEPQE